MLLKILIIINITLILMIHPLFHWKIEEILENLKTKKIFKSDTLDEDFQRYCFDSILNVSLHKGIQNDSYIAFIKKK